MKKYLTFLLLALYALTLAGCGGGAQEKKAAVPVKGRALVVYYSRADENSGVGYIEKGNTKILAEFIAKATGADMFEIVPAKPYPKEYKAATEIAKKEKDENARPEIVGTMPDVSKYDVIFFGYPIWWHDLPMVCYTFFDKVKLEGKTVAPFCTHEGSGLSDTDRPLYRENDGRERDRGPRNVRHESAELEGRGKAGNPRVVEKDRV